MVRLGLRSAAVACVLLGGCASDHDLLATHDPPPTRRDASDTADASADAIWPDDGGHLVDDSGSAPPEPDRAFALTVLNAVNDVETARLCLVVGPAGKTIELTAGSGFPFGVPIVVRDVPGLDRSQSIRPVAVFADEVSDCLGALAAADAPRPFPDVPDADADGSPAASPETKEGGLQEAARALALPTLPPGALASSASYLLVLYGCRAGSVFGEAQEAICGNTPRGASPLRSFLVKLSRAVLPREVNVRAAHASSASSALSVSFTTATLGAIPLVDDMAAGGFGTRDGESRARELWGSFAAASVEVTTSDAQTWKGTVASAMQLGGVEEGSITGGQAFTLVLHGNSPNLSGSTLGHPFGATLVRHDPTGPTP